MVTNVRLLTENMPDGSVRWLDMSAAYHKLDEGYGIHGSEFRFGLERDGKVLVLMWMLPLYLSETRTHLESFPTRQREFNGLGSVDLHSPEPLYPNSGEPISNCVYLGGKDCYCDGSGLLANDIFDKTVADPSAIWTELERVFALWTTKDTTDER